MLNKIIPEETIQKAKKLINKKDKIVIVTHISPDGDALGSSLALYHFLTEIEKEVSVVIPNNFPDFLRWMPGVSDIVIADTNPSLAEELFRSAELIFCLDFNSLKRIAQLETCVRQSSAQKIMIDHHLHPEEYCDLVISHPEISSTSELIFRFICRMGWFDFLTKSCAECIYTGMMTDTGAFTFSSNSPAIYYIIGELLNKGIDKDDIYSKVYNTFAATRIRMQGYLLYEKMKIYKQYKTAVISLAKDEALHFNMQKGDAEGIVNIPLSIEKVNFSAFIREDNDVIRISLRSKGTFPTNQFASEVFNGGGHLNASGGEFYGSLEDALILFEKNLPKYKHLLV